MKRLTKRIALALLCALLCLPILTACSSGDAEAPAGMKLAVCAGDDFRLWVPTTWSLNTAHGVSGAYYRFRENSTVSVAKYEITDELDRELSESVLPMPEGDDGTARFFDVKCREPVRKIAAGGSVSEAAASPSLLGGKNATDYRYTATVDGGKIHVRQLIAKDPDRNAYYVFTVIADEGLEEEIADAVESMLEHFSFDEPYEPHEYARIPDEKVTAPEGMKLASDQIVAYRFFVPDAWEVNLDEGVSSAYLASDRSNVLVSSYSPDTDVIAGAQQYWDAAKEDLAWACAGTFEVTGETTADDYLGGRKALVCEYRMTVGNTDLHGRTVITAYGSMIYSVTYTAKEECFALHTADFERMISAFEFR